MLPDYAADFVDLDSAGKFYSYYDGKDQWRVATNPNGADTSLSNGQVANDGTFEPTKAKGKFYLVSKDITTALDLDIETGRKVP